MKYWLTLVVAVGLMAGTSFGQNTERALIAYMKVQAGTQKEFLKHAQSVIRDSRKEEGNLLYQLHQSAEDPQLFVFYELFQSHEALIFHRDAKHTKDFLAITKPITLEFRLNEFIPEGSIDLDR